MRVSLLTKHRLSLFFVCVMKWDTSINNGIIILWNSLDVFPIIFSNMYIMKKTVHEGLFDYTVKIECYI